MNRKKILVIFVVFFLNILLTADVYKKLSKYVAKNNFDKAEKFCSSNRRDNSNECYEILAHICEKKKYIDKAIKYYIKADRSDRAEILEWNNIKLSFSENIFEIFILKYPEGKFLKLAEERIDLIRWRKIKHKNTQKAYQEYIDKSPSGIFRKTAVKNIEILKIADILKTIKKIQLIVHTEFYYTDMNEYDPQKLVGITLPVKDHIKTLLCYTGKEIVTDPNVNLENTIHVYIRGVANFTICSPYWTDKNGDTWVGNGGEIQYTQAAIKGKIVLNIKKEFKREWVFSYSSKPGTLGYNKGKYPKYIPPEKAPFLDICYAGTKRCSFAGTVYDMMVDVFGLSPVIKSLKNKDPYFKKFVSRMLGDIKDNAIVHKNLIYAWKKKDLAIISGAYRFFIRIGNLLGKSAEYSLRQAFLEFGDRTMIEDFLHYSIPKSLNYQGKSWMRGVPYSRYATTDCNEEYLVWGSINNDELKKMIECVFQSSTNSNIKGTHKHN